MITPSHRIAILTRYLGPTNFRDSRVKAYTESGLSVTIGWDDSLSVEENHRLAAQALQSKMGWKDDLIEGGTSQGYVYVSDPACHDRKSEVA